MFTKAQLKLTFFYSLFFFILFWSFSYGLYAWMEKSFGESYFSQVKQQQAQTGQSNGEFDDSKTTVVSIAGDVALRRLARILIIFNSGLFFVIPPTSWFLARRTLKPIKQAHELQRQFVSDASHELRTPLSIMLGEVDLALKNRRSPEYYHKVLFSNKEELNRLSQLVENLLFLAREGQSKHNVPFEAVDITDIVNSVVNSLASQAKKKKINIHFEPPADNVSILGNASLLSQLFFNLINNALKFTHIGGVVTITINKKARSVEIVVKDNGIGIAHDLQKKVFERFYRTDDSRSENKGYGLGLSICRVIVKRHNGSLTVRSKEGNGSKFVVTLPVA